jgi:trigger factor
VIDGKGDLAFSLAFEVIPAFELLDHSGLELTRHIVEVTDAHIEEALKRMAANSREFEAKAEGALAETGDRLTIDFAGTVEGRAFDGGNAKDVAVELGAGRMLAGFEDQLLGASAGEVRTVTVTFPENYGVKELAGKPAEFAVTVSRIEVAKEPAIDDDFAERRGFEDLSGLKEALRRRIAREFDQMTAMKLKRDVLDALDKQYRFDLPEKLVEGEFDAIWRALVAEMQRAGKSFADEATNEEDARREYRAIAERRVRLGLVLGTLGEKEGVTVSEQELQQALYERVRQFPGQERRIFEHYRKNPGALIELRGPIFERKVVDLIVSQGKVADRPVAREELQAMVEDEEEQAAASPAPAAAEAHDHDDRDHDHSHEHGHHHHDHAHDHAHAPDRGQPHGTTPKPHRTAPASG